MDSATWVTIPINARNPEPATPPEYEPFYGWRVEVLTADGRRLRGIVGRSTGWRPCYLLLSRRNCRGGYPAPPAATIRRLYRVR